MISVLGKRTTIRCWTCTPSPNQLCSEVDSICENGTINRSTEGVTPPSVSEGVKSVTEEDEFYAKATTGPPVNDNKTADSNIVKVLGSIWNIATDEFTFNLSDLAEQAKLLPTTKRSLLKISAKIFDLLGLLSPFTIEWKVLYQVLCNECTDWDEQLSDRLLKRWNSLIAEFQTLNREMLLWQPFSKFAKISATSLFQRCIWESIRSSHLSSLALRGWTCGSQFNGIENQNCTIKETEHPQAWVTRRYNSGTTG